MKTKEVDFITNNENYIRQKIFDGDLSNNDGTLELLRLDRIHFSYERDFYKARIRGLEKLCRKHKLMR